MGLTTSETAMRMPRMQALPPRMVGSDVETAGRGLARFTWMDINTKNSLDVVRGDIHTVTNGTNCACISKKHLHLLAQPVYTITLIPAPSFWTRPIDASRGSKADFGLFTLSNNLR